MGNWKVIWKIGEGGGGCIYKGKNINSAKEVKFMMYFLCLPFTFWELRKLIGELDRT